MKYKQIWLCAVAVMALVLTACNPIESNDGSVGSVITASQIKLDVHATTTGGNQIVMINNTPGVAGMWKTGVGTSTNQTDTVLLPFLGTNTIYFYATCAGGIVKDSTTITITTIDHPLAAQWKYLTGGSSKTWVWATDFPANWVPSTAAGKCYGNGAYLANNGPGWWTCGLSDLQSWGVANDQMIFDVKGNANFTLVTGNTQPTTTPGKGLSAGTYKGTYKFDMSQTLTTSSAPSATNSSNWSIGVLTLSGATVSLGYQPNVSGYPSIYSYNILYLDDNVMILACPEPSVTSAWGTSWFWIFKRQGYTFQ